MTAALYAERNGKNALVIEKAGFGGQITHSPKVENYPGTLSMSGNEFAAQMMDQILAQGAEIELAEVDGIDKTADGFLVKTVDGDVFEGRTVILATGVKHRMLGLDGEEELVGEGISFCAVCDGDFYTGRDVCVIGGGNSALQEAVLLAGKCNRVTILQDLPYYTGEQRLQDQLFAMEHVKGLTGVKVVEFITENGEFAGVKIRKEETGETEVIPCDGVFEAIGLIPENEAYRDMVLLDEQGYFATDETCLTKTSGIFVAGDCRRKNVRQLTTAVADGATAALAACRYIADRT